MVILVISRTNSACQVMYCSVHVQLFLRDITKLRESADADLYIQRRFATRIFYVYDTSCRNIRENKREAKRILVIFRRHEYSREIVSRSKNLWERQAWLLRPLKRFINKDFCDIFLRKSVSHITFRVKITLK